MYKETQVNFCLSESFVFICDFHREQAWERWLSKKSNGCVERKQEILAKLRRVAHALTEKECNVAIAEMKTSHIWKDPDYKKLVEYVDHYWLKEKKVCFKIYLKKIFQI